MKAFERVKDSLAAVAARKPHRSSERSQDPAEYLHITMASSSSDIARSSGQHSGTGQSSRGGAGQLQRSGTGQVQRSGTGQLSGAQRSKAGGGSVSWFGVPLDMQPCELDRGRRVPKLLAALRRAMDEQGGLEQEGIFRESPDRRLLSFIRQRLEAGEEPDAVLEGCSSEIIGALIKAWFGELPGGVWVGSDAKSGPKAKKGSKKSADASGKELETQLLAAAQSGMPMAMLLKQGLPPGQREALLWLLDLLSEAAAHSAASKMGLDNLAVVFAPALLPTDDKAPPLEQLQRAKDGVVLVKGLLHGHKGPVLADSSGSAEVEVAAEGT